MIIQLEEFTGEAPRWHPRVLQAPYAQQAILTKLDRRTLAPFTQVDPVFDPTKSGTMKTIYRFGQDSDNDEAYWFHWATEVSVIRSPANATDERTYYFGDGEPKVTDETLALSGGGTNYPIGYLLLGLPRPEALSAAVSGTPTSEIPETRNYIYTYVTAWGEEGPPSLPMPTAINVKPGEIVTLDIGAALPSGEYDIAFKRIYRTGTGETTTDYLLVVEVDAEDEEYVDSTPGGQLGAAITSTDWEAPPTDIAGAVLMPNGVILAWRDNEIWPSEPFVPHAYPPQYVLTTDSTIVGIAVVGMTAVVVTSGQPYLITGVHPESFTMEQLDIPQAGVSRRGILAVDGGVIYVSPDGLVHVRGRTGEVVTRDLFRREDWQALNPASMHTAQHEGRLFAFYDNESLGGTPGGLLFDFFGENQSVIRINQYFNATYTDLRRDALFLCGDEETLVGAPPVLLASIATSQVAQQGGSYVYGAVATQQAAQSASATGTVRGDIFGTVTTRQAAQSASAAGATRIDGTVAMQQAAQRTAAEGSAGTPADLTSLPWTAGRDRFYWHNSDSAAMRVNLDGTGGVPALDAEFRHLATAALSDSAPMTAGISAVRRRAGAIAAIGSANQLRLGTTPGTTILPGGASNASVEGFTLGMRCHVTNTHSPATWTGYAFVGDDNSPKRASLVVTATTVEVCGDTVSFTYTHGLTMTTPHSFVVVASPLGGGQASFALYIDGVLATTQTQAAGSYSQFRMVAAGTTTATGFSEEARFSSFFYAEQAFTVAGDVDTIFDYLQNGAL